MKRSVSTDVRMRDAISWDPGCSDDEIEWFTMYATSRGSTRELLLISALTPTSALIGKTTVEVFGTYEEPGNLFMIAVAPSGSGTRTPACHLGCTGPIVGHRAKDQHQYLDRHRDLREWTVQSFRFRINSPHSLH